MKRLSIIVVLALALVLLYGGVAYANFGPHGGYVTDTDACAGCHRAHTSFSPLRWTDSGNNTHSALLISAATTMEEFCYACHGDYAPGASTNVQSGVFDAGPSSGSGSPAGSYPYVTNSAFNTGLNGGGFDMAYSETSSTFRAVTSEHNMEDGTLVSAWGVGNSYDDKRYDLKCTDCHDPHGSSNYRLLKDSLTGDQANTVGGYDASDTPMPFVISAEVGYPAGGWRLHSAGASDMAGYRPNYTTEEYAYKGPVGGYQRSMSAWCSGCHERYIDNDDTSGTVGAEALPWVDVTGTYDYGVYEEDTETVVTSDTGSVGARARHRHKVNTSLVVGRIPNNIFQREVITDTALPLEFDGAGRSAAEFRGKNWDYTDMIGCLTCHFAHGTSANMTGWAEASLVTSSGVVTWFPQPTVQTTVGGVNPNNSSALLRTDNRGVCERCHNK